MKVFEAFSGYGSQSMALKRAGIPFEVIGISEIDKYAITAYEAVHGKVRNFGDISLINEKDIPDHNLFTYSFPCQDISVSGKLAGLDGTRSGLLWECERIIEHKKPDILLMENVKNLVGKKFKPDFDKWCNRLEELGYRNYWKVLNAKEHGVPQNRERVFMISVLDGEYEFPETEELKVFLKDILEEEVAEKYYLRPEQYLNMLNNLKNKTISNTIRCGGRGMNGKVHTGDIAPTLTTNKGEGLKIVVGCAIRGRNPENPSSRVPGLPTKQMLESDGNEFSNCLTTVQKDSLVAEINRDYSNAITSNYQQTGNLFHYIFKSRGQLVAEPKIIQKPRGFNKGGLKDMCPPITSSCWQENNYLLSDLRVRKLTPLECFRLMGVSDEDFFKIQKALNETFYKGKDRSSSQLYKMAGNSIVVDVLVKIFKML